MARRPARPATRPTIRIMGDPDQVEAALARLAAVGFVEVGRARMRDQADGIRVYGVLGDDQSIMPPARNTSSDR